MLATMPRGCQADGKGLRKGSESAPGAGLLPPEDVNGNALATASPCPGGKAARPDTCFLTHRYATRQAAVAFLD